MTIKSFFFFIISITIIFHSQLIQAKTKNSIIVSIKPIHSLAIQVAKGIVPLKLLLNQPVDPHDYQLKPSDARLIHKAHVIFWIGKPFEEFLIKPMSTLSRTTASYSLYQSPGIKLYSLTREAQKTDPHAINKINSSSINPHVWLDPNNAKWISRQIAKVLIAKDPDNTQKYRDNLHALETRLKNLEAQIIEKLAPVSQRPFIVIHDAYTYFSKAFKLNMLGALLTNEDQRIGAKTMIAFKNKIRKHNIQCIITEPWGSQGLTDALTEGIETKIGRIDPLGSALPAGEEQYYKMMMSIADTLVDCLSP